MELLDHQASKLESFQQHADHINAIKILSIDRKDTSNDRNIDTKFGAEKVNLLANNKICKARSATCNSYQNAGVPI